MNVIQYVSFPNIQCTTDVKLPVKITQFSLVWFFRTYTRIDDSRFEGYFNIVNSKSSIPFWFFL